MRTDADTEALAELDLFRGCSGRDLATIARLTYPVCRPAGAVLCREGSHGAEAFVVVSGTLAVTVGDSLIALLGPGEIAGEVALLDGGPRTATVTALTPVRLLVMSRAELRSVVDAVPSVRRRVQENHGDPHAIGNGCRTGCRPPRQRLTRSGRAGCCGTTPHRREFSMRTTRAIDMQRIKGLLVIAGVMLPFGLAVCPAHAAVPAYNVFVGYADTARPNAPASPTPFDNGGGVILEGQSPTTTSLDTGAVRVANASAVAETVDFVTVDVGAMHFDLWPHGISLPSGGQLVLDQTAQYNLDTSDFGNGTCTNDGVTPTVTVSVDGAATVYSDSGQVLNTGGVDGFYCPRAGIPAGNESAQWVSIGSPPCATGAVLTLSPTTQTLPVGSTATVSANFSACGSPLQGGTVSFTVASGPNAGVSGSSTSDALGNASFSYSSLTPGSDAVQASVTNSAGTIASNSASIAWTLSFAPGGGAFAIGDLNASSGSSVTFWGAQWWMRNHLSGGLAPATFKGFALNPSTPSCGTGWSTDPGNSAPPPKGPLPQYMGVIVTSSARQSGAMITGNTTHMVVVRTNTGYAADPASPGTGTVVAQVC